MFFLKWIDIVMHSKINGKSIWSCYIFVMFHRIMPVLSKFNYVHPCTLQSVEAWQSYPMKAMWLWALVFDTSTLQLILYAVDCQRKDDGNRCYYSQGTESLTSELVHFRVRHQFFFLYFCIDMVLSFIYRTFIKYFLSSRFSYSHQWSSLKCDCLELP